MNIRELAEREHRAEANRKTAEEHWRRTWWATTMALGKTHTKPSRAEAVGIVEQATGQSRGWIQSRAKTGEAFGTFTLRAVSALPPRMAVELARCKVEITAEVIKNLLKAEANGMSLREFSRQLTGKAWADTPAGISQDALREVIASQPELVGQLVAQHHDASQAHDAMVLSRHERGEGYVKPADWDSSQHVLTRLTMAVKQLRHECEAPGDLTENARATIDWALAELNAIKEGRDFVGEIEAWLEGSTR
jgi:hypothetical protein